MSAKQFSIPAKTNLILAFLQIGLMLLIFWGGAKVEHWWQVALLALAYGIVMNSGYAILHEAEHNLFHPNKTINTLGGVIMGFFFPAPFHLLRQGHLGHHIRNRSDDEAFDLYFEGDSTFVRMVKFVQLYGTLTGLFWMVIVLANIFVLCFPFLMKPKASQFNRPTEALLESLNPRYQWAIRVEALLIIAFHVGIVWWWGIPVWHHLAILFGFGFIWSAMQYAHHFDTDRDVRAGAKNLKTNYVLDLIWLNHNWHLNHHLRPTVPWIHLPKVKTTENDTVPEKDRESLLLAYLKMWRGPKLSKDSVENRFAGKVIR